MDWKRLDDSLEKLSHGFRLRKRSGDRFWITPETLYIQTYLDGIDDGSTAGEYWRALFLNCPEEFPWTVEVKGGKFFFTRKESPAPPLHRPT